jgi:hypothetical protein
VLHFWQKVACKNPNHHDRFIWQKKLLIVIIIITLYKLKLDLTKVVSFDPKNKSGDGHGGVPIGYM